MKIGKNWILGAFLAMVVVAANVLLYVVVSSHPGARVLIDSKEYLAAASNWVKGGVFYCRDLAYPVQLAAYTKRPPGYPVMIGLIQFAGGWIGAVVLAQCLLSLLTGCLTYWICRGSGLAVRTGLLTAAVVLLYPPQLIYSHLVMAEILFQFLLVLAVFLIFEFGRTKNWGYLWAANLALGIAVLTKPVLLYFWIPNLLFSIGIGLRRRSVRPILPALIPVLVVSLWSYRNYVWTGHYHFSSIAAITMHLRLDAERYRQLEAGLSTSDPQEYRQWIEQVRRAFVSSRQGDPGRALYRHVQGVASFFLDPGRFDIFQVNGWPHDVRFLQIVRADTPTLIRRLSEMPAGIVPYLVAMMLINGLVLGSFAYLILFGRLDPGTKVFIVLLVGYLVVATGSIGTSSYRLAVEPLLLLGTGFLSEWVDNRRRRRAAAYVD